MESEEESVIKRDLQISFYIKRDYTECTKLVNQLFDKLRKPVDRNKHKCIRDNSCKCVYLGKYIIDIYLNNTCTIDIMKHLEEHYYLYPSINLPCVTFKYLCKSLLKTLDYLTVRTLVENYLMYSSIAGHQTLSQVIFHFIL